MEIDFNDYKNTYEEELQRAISFSRQGVNFFTEAKANSIFNIATEYFGNIKKLQMLDVGCGIGLTDKVLLPHLPNIHGVDIAEGIIDKAKKNNPDVNYKIYDGQKLPYPDNSFDLVFTICVLHCIHPNKWEGYVREMARVTKEGGIVIVFEHNPLNPFTRYVVRRCALAAGAFLLGPKKVRELFSNSGLIPVGKKYILLFPWKSPWSIKVENLAGSLPLGAQYCIIGRK